MTDTQIQGARVSEQETRADESQTDSAQAPAKAEEEGQAGAQGMEQWGLKLLADIEDAEKAVAQDGW